MISAKDMVESAYYALDNYFGYIWGQWGAVWTLAKQNQKLNYLKSQYGINWKNDPDAKKDNYYQCGLYGDKWIGHNVLDCSGLLRWIYDRYGEKITHSSDYIWKGHCKKQGELKNGQRDDGIELKPGTAVFVHPSGNAKRTHIGLYVGNETVIESASTQKGVITSSIQNKKWVEWGELKLVEYGGDEPIPDKKPTLKKGDSGAYVTLAQTKLLNNGYDLGKYGADGKFGTMTEEAVKRFQADHGLTTDGVIGTSTWDALDNPTPVTILYTVSIPHLTKYKAEALVAQYAGASMIEERR